LCCLIILVVIFFYGTTSVIVITLVCFHNLFFFISFSLVVIADLPLNWKRDPLQLFFMIFIGVVRFVSSRFFLWYKWYYTWSFNVSMRSSFLYSLISSPSFSHLKSVLTHFNNFFVSKYSQPQLVFNHHTDEVMLFLLKRF
jgi:hypothetical protein